MAFAMQTISVRDWMMHLSERPAMMAIHVPQEMCMMPTAVVLERLQTATTMAFAMLWISVRVAMMPLSEQHVTMVMSVPKMTFTMPIVAVQVR